MAKFKYTKKNNMYEEKILLKEKEENQKNNVEYLLKLLENNYNLYFQRSQDIDTKSGLLVAFHGAILMLLVKPEYINNILKNMQIYDIRQILKNIIIILLAFAILILALIAILYFISSLKSRDIVAISSNMANKENYNSRNIKFKLALLKNYKEISYINEKVIEEKHKEYNIGLKVTKIEIILEVIYIIFTMF